MIKDIVAQSVSGTVTMHFDPGGLRWALSIPVGNLVTSGQAERHPADLDAG